jgi:uncharacterized protein YqgC (DUF456 family)
MDVFWIVLGGLLMVAGLAGCFLPFIPGPPLCFVALLVLQLRSEPAFSARFLIIWASINAIVTLLDYYIPIYGTKKLGGSKYGVWGCTVGLLVGMWLGPVGIILGPFVGAFVGEMIYNSNFQMALKSALGSFLGFLAGTLLKLMVCLVMCYYFIKVLI